MINSVLADGGLWHANMAWLSQTQFIQNMITPLILKFPCWSERSAECFERCVAALKQIGTTPAISADQWCRGLAELEGYDLLPSESKEHFIAKFVSDAGGDQVLRGTPNQMLIVLEELTSGCTPWDFDEWEEFARCAFADEESRSVLVLATEVVIEALKFSIDSRRVAFDIQSIAKHSPATAFAYCMSWMTEFLAWTENAWPSPIEVKAIGHRYVPEASDPSELHELTKSTMALLDPRYEGMRSSRLRMQHPFRFRLTNIGRGLPQGKKLGLNINRDGDLIGLFVSEQSTNAPTGSDSLAAASKSIKERQKHRAGSKTRKATVTDRDRAEVLAAIKAYKSNFKGTEPSPTALRKALIGRHVSSDKVTPILNELRETGEYKTPRRYRG